MNELLLYLVVRISIALLSPTYSFPDETWQGPEIAHRDVFGYGWLTWEWTSDSPLRSPVYPSFFSLFFYIIKNLNLDYGYVVAIGPRILQGALSAIYDYYLVRLLNLEGVKSSITIVLVNYTLWYSLEFFSKTLINTFETALFTFALYNWIKHLELEKMMTNKYLSLDKGKSNDYRNERFNYYCRLFMILNVLSRQSAIIPWVFIWPFHLLTAQTNLQGKIKILIVNVITLMILLSTSIIIDLLYFKKFTSTFYNFLEFNLLSGQSAFFGVKEPTWFIFKGIPYVCLGWIIFFILGIYHDIQLKIYKGKSLRFLYYMLFTITILSLSAHKEDRFLLPLIPLIIYFICLGIEYINKFNLPKLKFFLIAIAIISNIGFVICLNTFQNVGALKTMSILRNRDVSSVYFFIQCHQTPFYSFLHKNIPMEFPDCSPTDDITKLESYQLQQDPAKYIKKKLEKSNPSHIVINNYLINSDVEKLIQDYHMIETVYHQYWIDTYFEDQYNVEFVIYELNK
ncbi:hypothetical protein pb186bvf_010170 [Paramecium bursaria]